MKKMFAIISISILLLTSCIANANSIYIDTIEIYQDSLPLAKKLKYDNGVIWDDYDSNITKKIDVYYSIDIRIGSSINIQFDTFSPYLEIDLMKLSISYNFIPETYSGVEATISEREDGIIKSTYFIESIASSYNVIQIHGWLTNHGPRYSGATSQNTNYVLRGVHLNILP